MAVKTKTKTISSKETAMFLVIKAGFPQTSIILRLDFSIFERTMH